MIPRMILAPLIFARYISGATMPAALFFLGTVLLGGPNNAFAQDTVTYQFCVWDTAGEDGDRINLDIDNRRILSNHELKNLEHCEPVGVTLRHATNVRVTTTDDGNPPNTSAIRITSNTGQPVVDGDGNEVRGDWSLCLARNSSHPNCDGSSESQRWILWPISENTVLFKAPDDPPEFAVDSVSSQSYVANEAIVDLILPEAIGGTPPLTYTFNPTPPPGLTFDPRMRTLSGTPVAASPASTYTYTATDASGRFALLSFMIEVSEPRGVTLSTRALTMVEGQEGVYSIHLDTRPEEEVTVTPRSDNLHVSFSPVFLKFGPEDWNTPKRIFIQIGKDNETNSLLVEHDVSGYGELVEGETLTIDVEQLPVLGIGAGPAVDEGDTATFTLRASPAPAEPLEVDVTVAQTGNFADSGEIGPRTLTIGTDGTGTLSVATRENDTDDLSGAITASVTDGDGYSVSADAGTASVAVNDDDEPVIRISSGPAVDEGDIATFTLRASPAPAEPLEVEVTVAQTGDFADSGEIGPRTVTIGTDGTVTLSVVTRENDTDDLSGAITASVTDGDGYSVSADGGTASVAVNDDDEPVIRISSGPAVDEGDTATFTLRASPAPAEPLDVEVTVAQTGNFADSGEIGPRTLTIGTDGTGTLSVATRENDTDDLSGAITASVTDGDGYSVSADAGTASVAVNDDDEPVIRISSGPAVDEGDIATFTLRASPAPAEPLDVEVTVAQTGDFAGSGEIGPRTVTIDTDGTGTLSVATRENDTDDLSGAITASVTDGDGYSVSADGGTASVAVNDDDEPVIRISSGPAVDEGDTATFTLTASPAPAEPLEVEVTVAQTGDFADSGEIGPRTVTIGTDGTATLSVATRENDTDDLSGAITASVTDGDGYSVSADGGTASVAVNDDDEPVIRISSGPAVDEGDTATFTLRASPAPAEPLDVEVTVAQTGDFADSGEIGPRTVTIGTDGTVTLSVVTRENDTDDLSGAITASVTDGDGYSVSADGGTASVAVNDDDEPVIRISSGPAVDEGDTATFTLRASPAPAEPLDVEVTVVQTGDFAASDETGPRTVTIGTDGTAPPLLVHTASRAGNEGDGSITVTVADGEGYAVASSESATATVTVNDTGPSEEEKQTVQQTVAGVAAATVSNVTSNIGARFSAPSAPTGGVSVSLAGTPLSFGSASRRHGEQGSSASRFDTVGEDRRQWRQRTLSADDLLRSSSFAIALGAAETDGDGSAGLGNRVTIWGRGDLQFFESGGGQKSGYDGDLLAGYLGVDLAMDGGWLGGVAISRVAAKSDYTLGGAGGGGEIEADLTNVHPYVRVAVGDRSEVWAILGIGTGEITDSAQTASESKSDLSMRMASAGARHQLTTDAGLDWAVLGDGSFARVETDDGVQAVDGISADVWRARVGVEASHTKVWEDGSSLTSFLEVAGREDGGDSAQGMGLEVSPGLVFGNTASGFSVEARGRALVLHSADNHREYGASITASLTPGASGRGLAMSIAPTWGTPDHSLNATDADLFSPGPAKSGRESLSLNSRVAYGFAAGRGILAPFAEFSLHDGEGRRIRLGSRYSLGPTVDLELYTDRRNGEAAGRSTHSVQLSGRIRF